MRRINHTIVRFVALMFWTGIATAATVEPTDWNLYAGSTLQSSHPTEVDCVSTASQELPGTYECRTITRVIVEEPAPPPPPPPPPTASGLLYQDLVRGPSGSPVRGWCADGSSQMVNAGSDTTLCGDPLQFEITQGQIIHVSGGTLPDANNGDLIIATGIFNGTVNCAGRSVAWCGDRNNGVSLLGQDALITRNIDLGVNNVSDITVAGLEMTARFSGNRGGGVKTNIRIVNNYVHDNAAGNGGAFGSFMNSPNLKILGNHTNRTGIAGQNNAHSIYYGGGGNITGVEIAYNLTENHQGGRCIQIYGHRSNEYLADLHIHHNTTRNCNGNAAILISHTDGQSGSPDNRSWIDSVIVEDNICEDNRIQFRGANLNGGDDWLARRNQCPINSTMGGASSSWVIVTDNEGAVTGNTR